MTAQLGIKRNMTAGEIVSQVIIVLNEVYGAGHETPHGTNLVFMGMGESFLIALREGFEAALIVAIANRSLGES
jgi:adenine C2-methylase RlmN of 23S rRNA A2503 and tRNA A37